MNATENQLPPPGVLLQPVCSAPSNVEILCAWAWTKVQLEREQNTENIHAHQAACRLKKRLEAANHDQQDSPRSATRHAGDAGKPETL